MAAGDTSTEKFVLCFLVICRSAPSVKTTNSAIRSSVALLPAPLYWSCDDLHCLAASNEVQPLRTLERSMTRGHCPVEVSAWSAAWATFSGSARVPGKLCTTTPLASRITILGTCTSRAISLRKTMPDASAKVRVAESLPRSMMNRPGRRHSTRHSASLEGTSVVASMVTSTIATALDRGSLCSTSTSFINVAGHATWHDV